MMLNELIVSGSYYFSFAALIFMIMFFMIAYLNGSEDSKTRRLLIWTAVFAIVGCLSELAAMISISLVGMHVTGRIILYTLNLSTMLLCSAFFNKYDISVTDTGIGIKKENLPAIFETFDRIDNVETHFIEGTGLGLSIVKNLLELMGGSIEAESEYGFTDYMTKPFKFSELEEMVSKYLKTDVSVSARPDTEAGSISEEGTEDMPDGKDMPCGVNSKTEDITKEKDNVENDASAPDDTIADIDIDTGLVYCENMEIYESIVEVYLEEAEKNREDLKRFYEEEAWSSYAIVAHAVKSSSKSIGAMNFSALSLEMEKAAKAENADYIRDNFSYYYESYEKVLKRLEEIMH